MSLSNSSKNERNPVTGLLWAHYKKDALTSIHQTNLHLIIEDWNLILVMKYDKSAFFMLNDKYYEYVVPQRPVLLEGGSRDDFNTEHHALGG
jgi:hypothetical protein